LFQNSELNRRNFIKTCHAFKAGQRLLLDEPLQFRKKSASPSHLLGAQRIDDIIANVFTPFVYLYADIFAKQTLKTALVILYSAKNEPG
jgi:hypothetical protein